MNTEDFVSYEQAVTLKECGLDWLCIAKWAIEPFGMPALMGSTAFVFKNSECKGRDACAPTIAQAAKWLREVKGIYVEVKVRNHNAFEVVGKVIDNPPYIIKHLFDLWDYKNPYSTYESALSAGIDAALELIKEYTGTA